MTADPLSREAALQRVKEAGRAAGVWGSPSNANPYQRAPSMQDEASAWAAGWMEGTAERKREKSR